MCGLSSPALAKHKLTRNSLFGVFEDRRFAEVAAFGRGGDSAGVDRVITHVRAEVDPGNHEIRQAIDDSYDLVVAKLPKRLRPDSS